MYIAYTAGFDFVRNFLDHWSLRWLTVNTSS